MVGDVLVHDKTGDLGWPSRQFSLVGFRADHDRDSDASQRPP